MRKKIIMSVEEPHQSESINPDDELIITNEPVMKTAIDIISKFALTNKLVLKAYGEIIPNAVAVANIITENILKGNSKIDKILSLPTFLYGPLSLYFSISFGIALISTLLFPNINLLNFLIS